MSNTINITSIIEAVITIIISILSVIVIPKLKSWLGNKLTSEQITLIKEIITECVRSAEQLYANCASPSGQSKKRYVLEYAKNKLAEIGLTIDDKEIEIYLESAVLELNQNKTTN